MQDRLYKIISSTSNMNITINNAITENDLLDKSTNLQMLYFKKLITKWDFSLYGS